MISMMMWSGKGEPERHMVPTHATPAHRPSRRQTITMCIVITQIRIDGPIPGRTTSMTDPRLRVPTPEMGRISTLSQTAVDPAPYKMITGFRTANQTDQRLLSPSSSKRPVLYAPTKLLLCSPLMLTKRVILDLRREISSPSRKGQRTNQIGGLDAPKMGGLEFSRPTTSKLPHELDSDEMHLGDGMIDNVSTPDTLRLIPFSAGVCNEVFSLCSIWNEGDQHTF